MPTGECEGFGIGPKLPNQLTTEMRHVAYHHILTRNIRLRTDKCNLNVPRGYRNLENISASTASTSSLSAYVLIFCIKLMSRSTSHLSVTGWFVTSDICSLSESSVGGFLVTKSISAWAVAASTTSCGTCNVEWRGW